MGEVDFSPPPRGESPAAHRQIQGQSRPAAYPPLRARPRPEEAARETEMWDLERVATYLAQGLWPRQVSQRGQISLYGKAYPAMGWR